MLYILQYIELNSFSLAIFVFLLHNMRRRGGRYLVDQQLFLALITLNGILLVLDTAMWLMEGRPGAAIHALYQVLFVFYNFLNPVICAVWHLYADYYIFGCSARLRRKLPFLSIPVFFNLLLSVGSLYWDIYFSIDENNVYQRGSFLPMLLGSCLIIIVYTLVFITRNRRHLIKKEYRSLLFFILPPALAGILQALFYGVVILWPSVTFSILIIFINLQNEQLRTDYLTGLYNRRYLDNYLQTRLRNREFSLMGGIMIDLNGFKAINDTFGHSSGDQALQNTAKLFRETFREQDFIARYGGDEFVILMELHDPEELEAAVARLLKNTERFNSLSRAPYSIELSLGYATFQPGPDTTAAGLLSHIDQLMYRHKRTRT